jgi:polysaccharide pyruvyl transferase WcaK-like protein
MGPRVGIWGTFDLENYGDMVFPLIIRHELYRRLPGAEIRAFSPLGTVVPNRFHDGAPVEGLGPWSSQRGAELAGELDCVLVGGGAIIHERDRVFAPHYGLAEEEILDWAPTRFFIESLGPDLERECPVAWNAVGIPFDLDPDRAPRYRDALNARAYLSVRDRPSEQRLRAIGVQNRIHVVPDPAFLLPRVLPGQILDGRLGRLRERGWYPADGAPTIVIQGNGVNVADAPALADALARLRGTYPELAVVAVATGPIHGDEAFADALSDALDWPLYRPVRPDIADVAAAIRGAMAFAGVSLHGNITAFAYGRAPLVFGWHGQTKLRGFASTIRDPHCYLEHPEDLDRALTRIVASRGGVPPRNRIERRIDEHFDRLAALCAAAAGRRRPARRARSRRRVTGSPGRERLLTAQRDAALHHLTRLEEGAAPLDEGSLVQETKRLRHVLARRERELRAMRRKRWPMGGALRALYERLPRGSRVR